MILDFKLRNKNQKLKLNGCEFAKQISAKFETGDVFEIAKKARVKIIYEKWFPTTIGEFDRKNQTICVNLNAAESIENIIAHELGHFFALDLSLSRADEEEFCDNFAKSLLEDSCESAQNAAKKQKET